VKSRLSDHISPEAFLDTHIKTDYSAYAINQVSQILKNWINDQAISRKQVEAITIDGATSLDLDDAIWVEKTKDWYCVWIHISDVTEAIHIFSPLDLEALYRTTSVYRRNHILDMIPPQLSNNLLSLEPYGGDKLTLSLQVDLDEQCNIKNYSFFESSFKSLKRYDYESFGYDFQDPDSEHFDTLQLLKEVSDKLRALRLLKGWILDFNDDGRKTNIWWTRIKWTEQTTTRISHEIIESLMVLANSITWEYMAQRDAIPWMFKRHDSLNERSYYNHHPNSPHTGLWVINYAHFTSPIRRYADMFAHRSIKAYERGDEQPYSIEDSKFSAKHSNNTRWKIDVLGSQIDMKVKGEEFMERTKKRLGRPLEVYDMKIYIRNSTNKSLLLPSTMTQSIWESIKRGTTSNWIWSAWVILLWREKELKELIKQRVLNDNVIWAKAFLSVLEDTQIIVWEWKIFRVEEERTAWEYIIKFIYKNNIISEQSAKYSAKITMKSLLSKVGFSNLWLSVEREKWFIQHACRVKVIKDIFNHFS